MGSATLVASKMAFTQKSGYVRFYRAEWTRTSLGKRVMDNIGEGTVRLG
jgi:hypothetical protein